METEGEASFRRMPAAARADCVIAAPASSGAFLFGDFRFDRRGGSLFRRNHDGAFAEVAIGSRGLEILDILIERAGEVVSKNEIIAAVWPGMVVGDSNLTVQIAALRRVLDHARPNDKYIQTVSRRGYRFVAPVTSAAARVPSAASAMQAEAIADLPAPGVPFAAPRLSIVVLPFVSLSNNPNQQYFADGMTDDLTTDLSRIRHMFVIARNTAFAYRNKQVAAKRHSGRRVRGRSASVQRWRNRVRINAQLIEAERDAHLWAERFDGDTSDLFALQNEITTRIAVAVEQELVAIRAFATLLVLPQFGTRGCGRSGRQSRLPREWFVL